MPPEVPYTEQSDTATQLGVLAIHAIHYVEDSPDAGPRGKLLTFRGRLDQRVYDIPMGDDEDWNGAWEWFPLTRDAGPACGVPDENDVDGDVDLFCAGHAFLSDGTIVVAGGNIVGNVGSSEDERPNCVFTLDPDTAEPVTPVPASYTPGTDPAPATAWGSFDPSDFGRWYPTMTLLPDDRIVMVGGGPNEIEVLESGSWSTVEESLPPDFPADPGMPLYPSMFVLPDGNLAYTGSEDLSNPNDDVRRSAFVFDPENETWVGSEIAGSVSAGGPTGGYAVMYEPGKIMRASGGSNDFIENGCGAEFPNVVTETLDLSDPESGYLDDEGLTWTRVGDMAFARHFHNLVTLADGAVIAVGGIACDNGHPPPDHEDGVDHTDEDFEAFATRTAELWDPDTGTWCQLAEQPTPRMYHSTALLLPDATVISMAGGRRQVTNSFENAEIFTPPYLLTGNPRPVLGVVAPDPILYGSQFVVNLADDSPVSSDEIDRFTLVGLASTTHGFDQTTRFMTLGAPAQVIDESTLLVNAPDTATEMLPGWYMLFAISTDDVPSVARYVRLEPVGAGGGRAPEPRR